MMTSRRGVQVRNPGALARSNDPAAVVTVSVVITCYNYGHYLADSTESALGQAGVSVEVIIVDDASTDGSDEVARAISSGDSRVRLIALARNVGPAEAFNSGLAVCQGRYVARLDADDLLTSGSLARSTALLERFAGVGFVYGHPVNFSTDDPPAQFRARSRSWTLWPGTEWVRRRCDTGLITST